MNLKPEEPSGTPVTTSQIVASLIYVIFGIFIWIPIGFLAAQVNLQLTLVIFFMSFVITVCKMYLGIK